VSHAHARLTPAGRLIMIQRIATGRPPAHVAAEMGRFSSVRLQRVRLHVVAPVEGRGRTRTHRPAQPGTQPHQAHPGVRRDPDQDCPAPVPPRAGRDRAQLNVPASTVVAGAAPAPDPTAGRLRSGYRRGHPRFPAQRQPLRARPSRIVGGRRREEARAHPRRRRMARPRPRDPPPLSPAAWALATSTPPTASASSG
jgi:hypothetical protein